MDAAAFEQVYGSFRDFHAYFAPLFGRRETREHSGHYLQALLVQSGERRNAENLSETVPGSARGMQRFLTDSPWDDEVIIGRLQEYLGTRLEHPEGVWVLDGSDFPKQGRKSVGVARQYCGRLGKVANCQAGMFLAYVSPLGRALVDKGLYLPESWTSDKDRCEAAGVPEDRQGYRSKTELALEMVGRAQERGHLKAGWVAADDAFGMSPSFREGLAALGMWYVLDVPSGFTVWPPEPAWTSAEYQGSSQLRDTRLTSTRTSGSWVVDSGRAEVGLDPADVRKINIIPDDALPYETCTGITYDLGNYASGFDRALLLIQYPMWRAMRQGRG